MTQASEQLPPTPVLQQGYEPSKVSERGLLIFLFSLASCIVIVLWVSWLLVKHYVTVPRVVDVPRSAVPNVDRFTPPNLQPTQAHNALPPEDLAQERADEAKIFDQLGWKRDPDTGTERIPDSIVAALAQQYPSRSTTQPTNGGQAP